MSRFDDEIRRAVAPLADEPLPEGILDEALDEAAPMPWRGAAAAIAVLVAAAAMAVGNGWLPVVGEASPTAAPSVLPTSAQSVRPTPSSEPTTAVSPAPSASPTSAPPVGIAEADGVRLTLELDTDTVAFEERIWATLTVANTGTDSVWWSHSLTCDWAGVIEALPPSEIVLQAGRSDWSGDAGLLKQLATWQRSTAIYFLPEAFVDVEGNVGCVTASTTSELPPGATKVSRFAWDTVGPFGAPPPAGSHVAVATFGYLGRGSQPPDPGLEPPGPIESNHLRVMQALTVTGPATNYLSPGEAVDRLLEDEAFASRLAEAGRSRWTSQSLVWQDGEWALTLSLADPAEALRATVDAYSGVVTSVTHGPRVDSDG